MAKPQFSDQDAESLARIISRADGAGTGQAGWDFLRGEQRDRYRRYARAILRAGYRLPTERKSMHARLDEVVARVEILEATVGGLGLAGPVLAEAVASVEIDADPRGARTMKRPRLDPVCMVPDCGCSGTAHP